jgi:beta-glucanase (GH16 family)
MKPSVLFLVVLAFGLAQAQPQTPVSPSLLPGGADKWELVWSDEFGGPDVELERKWKSQNGPSGHILSSRWRENAVVTNGLLRLVARKEKRGGQEWTAGSLWTREMFQYGYFECRYRYAAAAGLNNSFWLMPTGTNKITTGKRFEIDVNEGHYPDKINNNIHNHSDTRVVNGKRTHPTSSRTFTYKDQDFARDFQVHGLEWTKKELVFYLNGKEIRRVKNEFCLSPSSVWLSLAVIPWAGRITDAIDGTAMEADYVRIYRKKP